MCDYCENGKIIFTEDEILSNMAHWVGIENVTDKNFSDFLTSRHVFMDSRGYLRMVDIDDSNCLDHGEKVEIKFCPFCGTKFES